MNLLANPLVKGMFCLASLMGIAYGVSMSLSPGLPGNVRIGEVVCLAIAPFGLLSVFRQNGDLERRFFLIVKLLIAIAAIPLFLDLVFHQIPMEDILRSLVTVVLTLSNVLALTWFFVRFSQAIPSFLIGLGLGRFFFAERLEVSAGILANEYWDLRVAGWAGPLLLFILLTMGFRSRVFSVAATFVYAFASIVYGARSHGLLRVLAAASLYLPNNVVGRIQSNVQSRTGRLALGALFLLPITMVLYVEVAKTGMITQKAKMQIESVSNPYNPLELIASGRAGVFVGLKGVANRPFVGYGSLVYGSYYGRSHVVNSRENYVHSVILESMVYSGVLVGCLWLCLLWQQVQLSNLGEASLWFQEPSVELAASICCWAGTWVILFSPWVSMRLSWAIYFSIQFALTVYAKKVAIGKDARLPPAF